MATATSPVTEPPTPPHSRPAHLLRRTWRQSCRTRMRVVASRPARARSPPTATATCAGRHSPPPRLGRPERRTVSPRCHRERSRQRRRRPCSRICLLPRHHRSPVRVRRDHVVEHTGDQHRPTGGRWHEHRRRLDRSYRSGQQPRAPGCRSGGHALGARPRPSSCCPAGPSGRGAQAVLRRVQPPRRESPRPAVGPDRGLLPQLRRTVFLHAEAVAG